MIEITRLAKRIVPEHEKPVIAIAMYGKTPFIGWNSKKTSPSYKRKYSTGEVSYSRHAELHALSKIPHDAVMDRIVLYVCRLASNGKYSMAKPCKSCQLAIQEAGIKEVYFTNWNGEWEQLSA